LTAYQIHHGDCLEVLRTRADSSVDAVVTDPPYGLAFMGKRWDYDVPSVDVWAECLRVLKPGGHLLAFAGTRTQHRMAVRIEDAGFEIRDMIAWVYGSGFPKSLDVSKAIDKMDAAQEQEARRLRFTAWVRSTGVTARQIDEETKTNMGGHYTTAASQPAIMTREHLEACRHLLGEVPEWVEHEADIRSVESDNFKRREVVGVKTMTDTQVARPAIAYSAQGLESAPRRDVDITAPATEAAKQWSGWGTALKPAMEPITVARKPLIGTVAANVLEHGTGAINVDGCRVGHDDCLPKMTGKAILGGSSDGWDRPWKSDAEGLARRQAAADAAIDKANTLGRWPANLIHDGSEEATELLSDSARFFYCAKASKRDRGDGNRHPTVKPTDLMRYLCRLITPPNGTILDPFTGSGSTGKAAMLEGFQFIGIEREAEYVEIAKARIEAVRGLFNA
jgi:DNA modification methylase